MCWLSTLLGKHRFLGGIRWALEGEAVPVRINDVRNPHSVAHERTLCLDAARPEILVDGQRILADEVDAHAHADVALRDVTMMALPPKLLQHDRGVAEL